MNYPFGNLAEALVKVAEALVEVDQSFGKMADFFGKLNEPSGKACPGVGLPDKTFGRVPRPRRLVAKKKIR